MQLVEGVQVEDIVVGKGDLLEIAGIVVVEVVDQLILELIQIKKVQ